MFHIVLHEPEIPHNTGAVIRLCANTGCQLHLIEPLGFKLEDTKLKRVGLDYHEYAPLIVHANWDKAAENWNPERAFVLTTHGSVHPSDCQFVAGDTFIFGPESRGLPAKHRDLFPVTQRLRLPMLATSRSLNLANTVAVVIYEAWRQNEFAGARSD